MAWTQRRGSSSRDRKGTKRPAHPLLEFRFLLQGHGVSLGNDRDDVHHFAEVFHELKVKRSQAEAQRRQECQSHLPFPTQPWPLLQTVPGRELAWELQPLLLYMATASVPTACPQLVHKPSQPRFLLSSPVSMQSMPLLNPLQTIP